MPQVGGGLHDAVWPRAAEGRLGSGAASRATARRPCLPGCFASPRTADAGVPTGATFPFSNAWPLPPAAQGVSWVADRFTEDQPLLRLEARGDPLTKAQRCGEAARRRGGAARLWRSAAPRPAVPMRPLRANGAPARPRRRAALRSPLQATPPSGIFTAAASRPPPSPRWCGASSPLGWRRRPRRGGGALIGRSSQRSTGASPGRCGGRGDGVGAQRPPARLRARAAPLACHGWPCVRR
jgi:hypothetical protein